MPYYRYGKWYCMGIEFPTDTEAWEYYKENNK